MNILYQFAVSHYCEKARWALDYKGVPYQPQNLLPGPHVKLIKNIAPDASVPVLTINGQVIQGSDSIIDYLDQSIQDRPLTPAAENEEKQAREWESFLEQNIGDPLRCLLYHELLEHKQKMIAALSYGSKWYGKYLYQLIYPRLKQRIRTGMKVNARTAAKARQQVSDGVRQLDEITGKQNYLVGNSFSRADLTAASLLAPLVWPENSFFIWTEDQPEAITTFRDRFKETPTFDWTNRIYQSHRTSG